MAGFRLADAETGRKVRQDAHGGELGHADGEPAHGQRQQHQRRLPRFRHALDRRADGVLVETGVGRGHGVSQCSKGRLRRKMGAPAETSTEALPFDHHALCQPASPARIRGCETDRPSACAA